MFILNGPYASELLIDTLIYKQYPVLKNDFALSLSDKFNFWEDDYAIEQIKKYDDIAIFSNTEDSISWINENLPFSELSKQIELFKNKVKFREFLSDMYPNFQFQELDINEIDSFDVSNIKTPFIIKPAVGYFSMGVHKVENITEWPDVVNTIKKEMEQLKGLYPEQVMDTSKFIIEQVINGPEYAVDALFDREGRVIILDILKHPFRSSKDVADTVYLTSKDIIENHLERFEAILEKIGNKVNLKNFPLHLELREDKNTGELIPIEVNPMRFAGLCTTDIAFYAYGINIYEYFYNQEFPDWENILKNRGENAYYFTIIDCPEDIDHKQIEYFDYDRLLANYQHTLEVRKFNYHKHPVIAYIVAQTQSTSEIDKIMQLDFKDFITLQRAKIQ